MVKRGSGSKGLMSQVIVRVMNRMLSRAPPWFRAAWSRGQVQIIHTDWVKELKSKQKRPTRRTSVILITSTNTRNKMGSSVTQIYWKLSRGYLKSKLLWKTLAHLIRPIASRSTTRCTPKSTHCSKDTQLYVKANSEKPTKPAPIQIFRHSTWAVQLSQ